MEVLPEEAVLVACEAVGKEIRAGQLARQGGLPIQSGEVCISRIEVGKIILRACIIAKKLPRLDAQEIQQCELRVNLQTLRIASSASA
jgi:hypothetical protein